MLKVFRNPKGIVAAVLAVFALDACADWPTLHNDNQRSGYAGEVVKGPYERKWFRDFHDEMIATRVEAIVAEGKCYVGTFAGKLHALKIDDGSTAWTFHAAGAIGHSPVYSNGKLYVGSEGKSFDEGHVYCLNAADGKEVWRYDTPAGVWVSPATDGRAIYFGDRSGLFHAVDATTGKGLWTVQTGNMILTPASISEDQARIVFGSEDMHVYCVDPAGKLLWKSAKVGGLSMRDHAPTIWQGKVIVRTNPVISFHDALGMRGMKVLGETQKAIPLGSDDEVVQDKWGVFGMKWTEQRWKAEIAAVTKYLEQHPEERTFWAFNLEDGKEPWMAPICFTVGLHNPATPPTFDPKSGTLYVWSASALSNYGPGVPGGVTALVTVDPKTGQPSMIYHNNKKGGKNAIGWASEFAPPGDETQSLSLMGDGTILNTHQGIVGAMDLKTLLFKPIYSARDSYGGIFGVRYNPTPNGMPGGFYAGTYANHNKGQLTMMPNEWHGPDRSIVAISDDRIFWVVGSQVVCLGGPSMAKTDTGGTDKPPVITRRTPGLAGGANLVFSVIDEKIEVASKQFTADEMKPIAAAAPACIKRADTPLANNLRSHLDAAVVELIDGGPWAPLAIDLGIAGQEKHFWRTAQTMEILSQALPHLSTPVQTKAKAFLDRMWQSGAPLSAPIHPAKEGKRREAYDLGDGAFMAAAIENPKYTPSAEDLYAVWAYAQYADAWPKVLAKVELIQQAMAGSKVPNIEIKGKDADVTDALNRQINGTLAYVRIMQKAGRSTDADAGLSRLAALVTQRVHMERTDRRVIRGGHHARPGRYVDLSPELSGLLQREAGELYTRNIRDLMVDLPVWHQAFGERMIGGENYISTPELARAMFVSLADGLNAKPEELAKFVDQPWCKADLYYIEKLSAALRAADGGR